MPLYFPLSVFGGVCPCLWRHLSAVVTPVSSDECMFHAQVWRVNRKGLLSRNDQTHHRMGPKTMESIPPSKRKTQADIQLVVRFNAYQISASIDAKNNGFTRELRCPPVLIYFTQACREAGVRLVQVTLKDWTLNAFRRNASSAGWP